MKEQSAHTLTLAPFAGDFRKDMVISLPLLVVGGITGWFLEQPDYKGIAWGLAVCGAGFAAYHLLLARHLRIVFDPAGRTIYRQSPLGRKKLLRFDEAELLYETDAFGKRSAHLARKSDRYTSVQRISSYLTDAEWQCSEREELAAVESMLDGE